MFKIAIPVFCATALLFSASGAMAAAPATFQVLKGTTVSASTLNDVDNGTGLMMEGIIAKQQGHSGANYVLRDNTGGVAMHIPAKALNGNMVDGQYARVYGHINKVAGGTPMMTVNQVETVN